MEYVQRDVAAPGEIIATLISQRIVFRNSHFPYEADSADRINMGAWFHYPGWKLFLLRILMR